MSQKRLEIVLESTNVLDLKGLKDTATGVYLEDADVVASLFDSEGAVILGADELPAPHVAGTTGKNTIYRASLPFNLDLAVGEYLTKVVATAQDGSVRTFTIPVDAVVLP